MRGAIRDRFGPKKLVKRETSEAENP